MVKCEVLIGHLFFGHARRRKGEIVEMKPEAAVAAAKFGQVRILGGGAAPPSRGASEGGQRAETNGPEQEQEQEQEQGPAAGRKKGGR